MEGTSERGIENTLVANDEVDALHHVGYRLIVLSGALQGKEYSVEQNKFRIGKAVQCDLALPDESISRIHVEVCREGDRYRVIDQRSTNGTFVQGARVTDAFLKPGDILTLGQVHLRFVPRDGLVEPLPSAKENFGNVVGRSLAMRKVFGVLEKVANTPTTILFEGETGTGKDLLARAVHDASERKPQAFIVFDCAATTAEQLEAELFGREINHEVQIGALESANGGTIFFDDISDLPLELQSKLLRVLERRRFRRVGSEQEIPLDVRVIAASSRSLRELIAAGEFREDLYFVLAVVSCSIPPLRERREDIPMLIEVFSRRLPPGMWNPPKPEAMARLVGYDWPGNVRELRNVVERSAHLSPDGFIDLIRTNRAIIPQQQAETVFDPALPFREQKERAVELFEESYLNWLLMRAKGNISRAAREADMDRKYLHKLLRRYSIDAKHFASALRKNGQK